MSGENWFEEKRFLDEECADSLDCSSNSSSSLKFCYHEMFGTVRKNFCDCSNWYGFTGPNCTEVSAQVIYYRGTLILGIILNTLAFSYLIVVIVKYIDVIVESKPVKIKGSVIRASMILRCVFIASTTVLCELLLSLYFFYTLLSLFDPTRFTIVTYREILSETGDIGYVTSLPGKAVDGSLLLAFLILLLSSFVIAHSWIQITESLAIFQQDLFMRRLSTFLTRFGFLLWIGFTVLAISLLHSGFLSMVAILCGITGVFLMIFFVGARSRFMRSLLTINPEAQRDYANSISLINKSSRQHTICLSFLVISVLIHAVLSFNYGSLIRPGTINVILVCRDLGILGAEMLFVSNTHYISHIFKGLKTNRSLGSPLKSTRKIKQERKFRTNSSATGCTLNSAYESQKAVGFNHQEEN